MALIKCPECGRSVSDMATACPDCGYPIAKNNPSGDVRIKMNLEGYLLSIIVYEAETGRELWRGKTGEVAVIEVDKPTAIEIKGRNWTRVNATIKAGETYELGTESGFFSQREVLRKVDVIDSGR